MRSTRSWSAAACSGVQAFVTWIETRSEAESISSESSTGWLPEHATAFCMSSWTASARYSSRSRPGEAQAQNDFTKRLISSMKTQGDAIRMKSMTGSRVAPLSMCMELPVNDDGGHVVGLGRGEFLDRREDLRQGLRGVA